MLFNAWLWTGGAGPHRSRKQCGSVLIATLLILLILTSLALTASHATKNQSRIASAAEHRNSAFQSAEAALRAGERLATLEPRFGVDNVCAGGPRCRIYAHNTFTSQELLQASSDWWQVHGWPYIESPQWPALDTSAKGPRFIIEEYGEMVQSNATHLTGRSPVIRFYRITAVSAEAGKPLVLLQSMIRRDNCAEDDQHAAEYPDIVAHAPVCEGDPLRQSWRQLR